MNNQHQRVHLTVSNDLSFLVTTLPTPAGWPKDAPPYNSPEGWEFEKQRARNKILYKIKEDAAMRMCNKSGQMEDTALAAFDQAMYFRYHAITLRLLQYRTNLLIRYQW